MPERKLASPPRPAPHQPAAAPSNLSRPRAKVAEAASAFYTDVSDLILKILAYKTVSCRSIALTGRFHVPVFDSSCSAPHVHPSWSVRLRLWLQCHQLLPERGLRQAHQRR